MKNSLQISSSSLLCLILAGASASLATSAKGATIVVDPLTYAGSRGLSTAPTPIGATSGWTYGDPYTSATETATGTTTSGGSQIDLGVPTIVSGNIYTLSISEAAPTNSNDIVYLGFFDETSGNAGSREFYDFGGATLEFGSGGKGNLDADTGTNYTQIGEPTASAVNGTEGPNELQLVLDTVGTDWTLTGYLNTVEVGAYTFTHGNPTGLNSIYFATSPAPYGSPGTPESFTNIALTGVGTSFTVPEPATYAYLASGLAVLAFCLRRKRCQI